VNAGSILIYKIESDRRAKIVMFSESLLFPGFKNCQGGKMESPPTD
jgi:hypothetical protein